MPDNSSQTTAISTNDPIILSLLIDAVARNCQRRHHHLTVGEQELSRRLGDAHRRVGDQAVRFYRHSQWAERRIGQLERDLRDSRAEVRQLKADFERLERRLGGLQGISYFVGRRLEALEHHNGLRPSAHLQGTSLTARRSHSCSPPLTHSNPSGVITSDSLVVRTPPETVSMVTSTAVGSPQSLAPTAPVDPRSPLPHPVPPPAINLTGEEVWNPIIVD